MKKYISLVVFVFVSYTSLCGQELHAVTYKDGSYTLKGLITSNNAEQLPGVLILPAWKGIDDEAKNAALELEKEGYIAFIADIYGEGNIPQNGDEAMKIAMHYKNDFKAYQHRIGLALEQLKKSGAISDKVAVIGYCFGGEGALEVARAGMQVVGVVSIHGGYTKEAGRANKNIQTKVLIEHAADDQTISSADIDHLVIELNEGKADWQFITYANTRHTFTDPESKDYNPLMAKRAWNHTLLFLKEVLKK